MLPVPCMMKLMQQASYEESVNFDDAAEMSLSKASEASRLSCAELAALKAALLSKRRFAFRRGASLLGAICMVPSRLVVSAAEVS